MRARRALHRRIHVAFALVTLGCSDSVGAGRGADDAAIVADSAGADDASDGAPVDARPRGRRERCNGLDDDLDGRTDEGCPIRLTRSEEHDLHPSVHRGRVVWTRVPRANEGDVGDLYERSLPDGPERRVAEGVRYPALYGHRAAVLSGERIVVVDLDGSTPVTVPTVARADLQAPRIYEDLVSWSQKQPGTDEDYEVFAYDLRTGLTASVGSHATIQQFPLVEGATIVWGDDRRGHHTVGLSHLFDIYAADLRSPESSLRPLTTRADNSVWYDGSPYALEGGRALALEVRGDALANAATHTLRPVLIDVATGARTELGPALARPEGCVPRALSGPLAVLECAPDGASDLVLVDLRTMERRAVTNYPRRSTRPRLDGRWLVWQDDRNDHWDLYAMDLTDLEAGDFYPEGISP